MAREEIRAILSDCPSIETGCFASNPDALINMVDGNDSAIRAGYQRIAHAADTAGAEGLPLEDATYAQVTIVEIGSFPSAASTEGLGMVVEFGKGEVHTINSVLEGDNSVEAQIARCAYACGQAAICPLKSLRTELSG